MYNYNRKGALYMTIRQDIIDVSENMSKLFWDWMKKTDTIPHARATEPGMTSFLMYNLSNINNVARVLSFRNTGVKEAQSGADFYLVYQDNGITHKLLVQAKKLTTSATQRLLPKRYSSFSHRINKTGPYQYCVLQKFAALYDLKPYYIFYNSSFNADFQNECIFSLEAYFRNNIDSLYTINNKMVLGTFFTPAADISSIFTHGQIKNPTFREIMKLNSTLTLQEYFRRVPSITISPSGGDPDNDDPSAGLDDGEDYTPDNSSENSTEKIISNSNYQYENNNKILDLNNKENTILNEYFKKVFNTDKIVTESSLSEDSLKFFNELDDKNKEIVRDVMRHNHEHLPIVLLNK